MTLLFQRIDPTRSHRLRLVPRLAIVIKRLQLLFFLPFTIAALYFTALQSLMHSDAVFSYAIAQINLEFRPESLHCFIILPFQSLMFYCFRFYDLQFLASPLKNLTAKQPVGGF